ncbi:PIG-L family deacetylase [bacterium]|nr:PIG-L family deacetylase [bacterium]RQV95141.1 MAG: hypothetical protein EH221_06750 [bacterium]
MKIQLGNKTINSLNINEFPFSHVCVVSPHPDDSAIGVGGLIYSLKSVDNVHISVFVATPGFRGVDHKLINENQVLIQNALYEWLGLKCENINDIQYLNKQLSNRLGEDFQYFGIPNQPVDQLINNILCTAIRYSEVVEEMKTLGLDPEKSLNFLALPRLYQGSIVPSEVVRFKKALSDFSNHENPNLLIIPHPADPQPVHQIVAEASLRALEPEKEWHIWYYQSPWYTIPPRDVDIVIALDEESMEAKKTAAEKHKSQTHRTPYADIVRSQVSLNADVLPEQLLGYGRKTLLLFGKYCEVYQIRLRSFYNPGKETSEINVYSKHPLPLNNKGE